MTAVVAFETIQTDGGYELLTKRTKADPSGDDGTTDAALVSISDIVRTHIVEAGPGAKDLSGSFALFYDKLGSEIYEEITKQPEYYPTREEAKLLASKAQEIAERSAPNTLIVELGSGSSTKTRLLLDAFIEVHGSATYVPLDISQTMLEASAADLAADYGASLTIKAVHGLYEDGLALLASDPAFCDLPKLVLFLGSSIGNLDYNDAAVFLRDTGRTMVPSRDAFLVGMDFAKDPAVLEAAYDDAAGVTARFNLNVLTRINNDLGADFDVEGGGFVHRSAWVAEHSRIEMRLVSTRDQTVSIPALGAEVAFAAGEEIVTEHCHKYTMSTIHLLAEASDLRVVSLFTDRDAAVYSASVTNPEALYDPSFAPGPFSVVTFTPKEPGTRPEDPAPLAAAKERAIELVDSGFALSDRVFAMIAREAFLERPIRLRHPFVFYLGHLYAFAANQIRAVLGDACPPSINERFDVMFERGMDPNVETGECHDHSAAPVAWPPLEDILAYNEQVRVAIADAIDPVLALQSVAGANAAGSYLLDTVMAQGGRVFAEINEHTTMHAETLLYMYLNLDPSCKVRPDEGEINLMIGPSPARGDLEAFVDIPAGPVVVGANHAGEIEYGWDNEFPAQKCYVEAFRIGRLPITNEQYMAFVEAGGYEAEELWTPSGFAWREREGLNRPHTWVPCDDDPSGLAVQTIFDSVPMADARHWPVYVSQEEAAAFAKWRGMRLPTEAEWVRAGFMSPSSSTPQAHPWGLEEATPGKHGNFGFHSLGPSPVGSFPAGVSPWGVEDMIGNGWEWTSTPFQPLAGFEPYNKAYLGYSADFFDGEHHVMLGGSWATAPELTRRSMRDWFQTKYQYCFSTLRLADDAQSLPSLLVPDGCA